MLLTVVKPNLDNKLNTAKVKRVATTFLAIGLLFTGSAMAQSGSKQQIDATPTVAAATDTKVTEETAASVLEMPRLSYNLSVGAMYNSHFGASSYIQPTARYQISNRFRAHASFMFVSTMPFDYTTSTPEGGTVVRRSNGQQHYIASVGGDYLVNERLILSGNIWRDFSNMPAQRNMYNSFYSPGRMGADFSASYKVTDNFTITGGVRYSEGASPFSSPFYNSGFGNGFSSGRFGY